MGAFLAGLLVVAFLLWVGNYGERNAAERKRLRDEAERH